MAALNRKSIARLCLVAFALLVWMSNVHTHFTLPGECDSCDAASHPAIECAVERSDCAACDILAHGLGKFTVERAACYSPEALTDQPVAEVSETVRTVFIFPTRSRAPPAA